MQLLVNGLVSGMLVALPALALSLTFSVLRFANFAIGAMVTVGAYVIYGFNVGLGFGLPLAAVCGALLSALLAAIVDWLVYRPLRDRSGITLLVASMGVAFVLENAVRFVAGNTPLGYAVETARPWRWAGLRFNVEQLITVAVSLACLLLVALVFRGSRLGRAMRAVADNPSLAATRGVSRQMVATLTWLLAGALAALAGLLVGLDATLDPQMGWNYLLPVFAAAVLGGWSSPGAAVAGALVMGVLSELSTLALPAHYRTLVAFAALSLLLLLRPSGLFGRTWVHK